MPKFWEIVSRFNTAVSFGGTIYAVSAFGGIAMAYLAYATDWLEPWGPVAWGAIGIISAVLIASAIFLISISRARLAVTRYTTEATRRNAVNVLAEVHQKEKIILADFYHPYFEPRNNIRFKGCELYGPCSVFFSGGTFNSCGFIDCEIVIARSDRLVRGVTAFTLPYLLNCRLYRVTLFMNIQMFNSLPPHMKSNVPVISDGRIGDI